MKYYLENPRLNLKVWQHFLVDLIVLALRILLLISGLFLFLSNIKNPAQWFVWLGLLIFLIEGNYFIRFFFKKAKRSFWDPLPEKINLFDYLNPKAFHLISEGFAENQLMNEPCLEITYLKKLVFEPNIEQILYRLNIEPKAFQEKVLYLLPQKKEKGIETDALLLPLQKKKIENLKLILFRAFQEGLKIKADNIDTSIIFLAVLQVQLPAIQELLGQFKINPEEVKIALIQQLNYKKIKKIPTAHQKLAIFRPKLTKRRYLNRAWTSLPTPLLDQYGVDLTDLARQGQAGFLIGHQQAVERTIKSLEKKEGVILIGEPGSGRTTVVMHIAWLIVHDRVPEEIFDKRLISLDLASLYSADPENFEKNLRKITQEIIKAKNIILVLEEIHYLLTIQPLTIQLIKDLIDYQSPVILITTNQGYQKINIFPEITQYFQLVQVKEISPEFARVLLSFESLILEKQYQIIISTKAIYRAVELAQKFLKPKLLPGSARGVIEEAVRYAKKHNLKIVSEELIADIISKISQIPANVLKEEEREELLNLENLIHQSLINQDEAVKQVAQALRIYRAGLKRKEGPIGVFLFLGPTGVGKTYLAKILARIYFRDPHALIRFDMSQYKDEKSIKEFIGDYQSAIPGHFSEAVRLKPYSIVLLDEFEKTDQAIMNIFLPIFDEGIIKDALGREVDFKNVIFIATSNAHSELIKNLVQSQIPYHQIVKTVKDRLTDYFPVELINRFDEVIVFRPLKITEVVEIAKLQLKEIKDQVKDQTGAILVFSEQAIQQLAKQGYNPIYGARELRRVIEEKIRNLIANAILEKKIKSGKSYLIDFVNSQFSLLERK